MTSLIKKPAPQACCTPKPEAPKAETVAQCCAKVSKTVAGCHD